MEKIYKRICDSIYSEQDKKNDDRFGILLLVVFVFVELFLLAVVFLSPFFVHAAGYGGDLRCTPSTRAHGELAQCDSNDDIFRRMYELELKVESLEAQRQIGIQQNSTALEARVSKLESDVAYIRNAVFGMLAQIISLLSKITK